MLQCWHENYLSSVIICINVYVKDTSKFPYSCVTCMLHCGIWFATRSVFGSSKSGTRGTTRALSVSSSTTILSSIGLDVITGSSCLTGMFKASTRKISVNIFRQRKKKKITACFCFLIFSVKYKKMFDHFPVQEQVTSSQNSGYVSQIPKRFHSTN